VFSVNVEYRLEVTKEVRVELELYHGVSVVL
jgi:hypothetical protein